jgi:hypothetical protein
MTVMRALYRRDLREERGSIILALLGIIILTTVASVGLAAVVNGQHQSRHDDTFTQSLNNAESGIDAMVADIKGTTAYNDPSQATSFSGATTPTLKQSGTYGTYTVTASASNNVGSTGSAVSTTWHLKSIGTSTVQGQVITRIVEETVTIAHTYNAPLQGTNGLSLPPGSAVGEYQEGNNGNTPTPTVTTTPPSSGINLGSIIPGLPALGSTTITGIPSGGSPGAAADGGALNMSAGDLQNFASIGLDGAYANCTTPPTDAAVCDSTIVAGQTTPPPTIATTGCSGNAVGAGVSVDGAPLVNLNVPLFGLVLNDNVDANLAHNPPLSQTVCTNLPVVIPTVGTNIGQDLEGLGFTASAVSGLLSGLGGGIDIPIGANCLTGGTLVNLLSLSTIGSLACSMNPPQDLVINEMAGSCTLPTATTPAVCSGGQTVYVGTGTSEPTYVSAIIANPAGNCTINGNVILLGALNCNTITYTTGSSLTVDYPTDAGLTYADTEHRDSVSNWNECQSAKPTNCP